MQSVDINCSTLIVSFLFKNASQVIISLPADVNFMGKTVCTILRIILLIALYSIFQGRSSAATKLFVIDSPC